MSQEDTDFESHRAHLFAIAYRMLGTVSDAEDTLQDAFLRWQTAQARETISAPRAMLTTIVTRLCLDKLKSAQMRRETYIGPWLPEPLLTQPDTTSERAEMRESISLAFLTLMERLTPAERAVFLLREVFDYDYAEIAAFVGKSEPACRQIFSRAQKYVRANRPRLPASPAEHSAVLNAFLAALASGDLGGLTAMLHESVTMVGDGGGKAYASKVPQVGIDKVTALLLGLRKLMLSQSPPLLPEIARVNGWDALVLRDAAGHVNTVMTIETDGRAIYAIRSVINPDKLGAIGRS